MLWRFIRALVFSELWIGLGCALQVAFSLLLIGEKPNFEMMLWAGFSTIAVYNWQRLVRVSGKVPELFTERHLWIDRNRPILWVLTVLSLLVAFYFLLTFSEKFIMSVFLLSILAFFYTLPWYSGNTRKGLRELPYLKLFLIAICWVGVTAVLPVVSLPEYDGALLGLMVVERFLFILAITIPFDVRDLDHDSLSKKTIPQVLGERRAIALSLVLWIASAATMIVILNRAGFGILASSAVMIGYILTAILIRRSDRSRPELHYTGALDGTLVVIPLLLWLTASAQ